MKKFVCPLVLVLSQRVQVARSKGWFRIMLERSGLAEQIGTEYLFHSVDAAVEAYQHPGETELPPADQPAGKVITRPPRT